MPVPDEGSFPRTFPRGLCVGGAGTERCIRDLQAAAEGAGEFTPQPRLQVRTELALGSHSRMTQHPVNQRE